VEPTDVPGAYLRRLAGELTRREFTVAVAEGSTPPCLTVANGDTPELHEQVLCQQADDGSWCWWWPWHQPIGSVDDLDTVIVKITTVLRSVGGVDPSALPVSATASVEERPEVRGDGCDG
jgi:hypothetical protein